MMEEANHSRSTAATTDSFCARDAASACKGVNVASTAARMDIFNHETPERQQQQLQLFDLSLIQQRKQQQLHQQLCDESTSLLPPMESLTMCTTDDDNTSVSSVSTQGSQQRRSMFSQYWKKTGQEPPRFLPRSPSSCGAVLPDESRSSSSSNGPEGVIHVSAAGRGILATPPEHEAVLDIQVPSMAAADSALSAVSKTTPNRRSMFPRVGGGGGGRGDDPSTIRQSSSAPSLISYDRQYDEVASLLPSSSVISGAPRKIRSYSHLLSKQPSSSCLRESRFSPNKSGAALRRASYSTLTTDSSSSVLSAAGSSVRFDMHVTILHFDLPQERFAHEGWSDYFQ
jgi:hypothetical protein